MMRDVMGVMEMFRNWIIVIAAQFCTFTQNNWIVNLQWMNFTVYMLYSNKAVFKKEWEKEKMPVSVLPLEH